MTNSSSVQETMVTPAEPPEKPTILDANGTVANGPEDLTPVHHPAPLLPGPQPAQAILTAHQTCSSRVVRNTPCYEQSVNQHDQGLVAWEVLLAARMIGRTSQQPNPNMRSKRQWKTPCPLQQ